MVITFTDDLKNAGKELIEKLDVQGSKVDGALWFYFPEENYWKLLLSFPNIDKDGPKIFYTKIQKALSSIKAENVLKLDDVVLTKRNAPLLSLLKSFVNTGPNISGIRFSNNIINGQLIPDAYIYRLQ